jgi:class 3 adenylate cyclase
MAMRSPGIELDELLPVFEQRLFTLQPMDLLFPEPARMTDTTVTSLAASLDMDAQQLMRVIVAAGLPAPRPDDPMRADDVRLIGLLVYIGQRIGGDEIVLRMARLIGEPARRSAENAVALFDEQVTSRVIRTNPDIATRTKFNLMAADVLNKSEQVIGGLYLRQVEHALLRLWADTAESFLDEIGTRPHHHDAPGLAFVDLAGFTRLTQDAGDDTAARLAASLAAVSELAATRHAGRVVKLLGDGAMLYFEQPLDAVRGALDLVATIVEADLPPAHAGVHSGPMIRRDGDYFGRTVNLAARIAGQAVPGQVLVSAEVGGMTAPDLDFESVGPRELKGIGEVQLFAANWR